MSLGRFFKLDEQSDLSNDRLIFRYLRFENHPRNSQFSIYLTIQHDGVEFFYASKKGFDHSRLFKISLNDSSNPQGGILQQLNHLKKLNKIKLLPEIIPAEGSIQKPENTFKPTKASFDNYADLEIWQKLVEEPLDDMKNKEPLGHMQNDGQIHFCFANVFLDFLFDLYYTYVFRESRHFEQLRASIKSNPLYFAILAKCEYYFSFKKISLNTKNYREIEESHFKETRENWLDILTDETNIKMLAKSDWFDNNLEKEINEIIIPKEIGKEIEFKKSIREKVLEFYIDRLAINSAFKFYKKNPTKKDKSEWIIMSMPKLLITIFLSWIAYSQTLGKTPGSSWLFNLVILFIGLFFIFIYLNRELRKIAPYLSWKEIIWRGICIISYSFFAAGSIGAILLTILYSCSEQSEELDKINFETCGSLEIAFQPWLSATIFVVFFSLFVNFLFKGEKFSSF